MRLKLFFSVLSASSLTLVSAQELDSIRNVEVERVVVVESAQLGAQHDSALPVAVVDQRDMAENFMGNLMKSLEYIPGVQSMSVGSGFSKPMIRGMGFNRVSVVEGGVKQEGQQWGSDHGLEIDAFNIERVNIRKGSSSLLYGSDAMGGVVDIMQPVLPAEDGVSGSVDLLGRTVNDLIGGSLMVSMKRGGWFVKARHSEQHFADFAVPTDTVVYLTQKMPLIDNRVTNTAGFERSSSIYARYGGENFSSALSLSNAYQKAGFYPGAHGVPDPSSVVDDGDLRDVDLPYSTVDHLKISSLNRWWWGGDDWLSCDLAYQNNHREEWSEFHTHYSGQQAPDVDPDLEIKLLLSNYSSNLKWHTRLGEQFTSTVGLDLAYQDNRIGGYSFLLPSYRRSVAGLAWVVDYTLRDDIRLSGGVRYDYGHIQSDEYEDEYLVDYLGSIGTSQTTIDENRIRSYALDRDFGDYSLSLGGVWDIDSRSVVRLNLGRSFRLPTANELVSNGVHHGSFRHEKGDPTLDSERGWQVDAAYTLLTDRLSLTISPYASWYASYIYQQPTGEWSILPHAGQVYQFTQSEALLSGGELAVSLGLRYGFRYDMSVEYSYTYNLDEHIALPFTPPVTMRNSIWWSHKWVELMVEWQMVAAQNRVARNEDPTPGAQLFNAKAIFSLSSLGEGATAVLSADNIFNTLYLNHLSYYRQVEIPEAGRNIQLSIKIPFKL